MMLQGVIDCFLLEEDAITVIDFKTDRVSLDTVEKRAEQYRGQVQAYADALEKMYGMPVKEKILYFFQVNKAVFM